MAEQEIWQFGKAAVGVEKTTQPGRRNDGSSH